MGRRGRVPEPTALKVARGSVHAERNKREPKPPRKTPRCPRWLDARAKKMWNALVKLLDEMKVLTIADGHALARYCQTWVQWRKYDEFVMAHGAVYTVKDQNGNIKMVRTFPQALLAERLNLQLLRYEQEFGLTPAARTRIYADLENMDSDEKTTTIDNHDDENAGIVLKIAG